MNRLVILGTGSGLSTPDRDYTHLCWDLEGRLILIDCGSNPFARLLGAGLDLSALHDVVITHRHIDHLAALPTLLDQLKLRGRTAPLRIYGLAATLHSARDLVDVFLFERVEDAFALHYIEVPETAGHVLIEEPDFRLSSFPAQHPEPVISLRLELRDGETVTYSADTGPHPGMASGYAGTTTLVHECTFDASTPPSMGHSRTVEVGAIARDCGATRLIAVHLGSTAAMPVERIRAEIATHYSGEIIVAADGDSFTFAADR
jgi:ribonuclease Z